MLAAIGRRATRRGRAGKGRRRRAVRRPISSRWPSASSGFAISSSRAGGERKYAGRAIDRELLETGAEADLHAAFGDVLSKIQQLGETARYEEALREIAALRPAVDRFFDDVLVMAEDRAVRENRLTFLARLLTGLSSIADFSEIVSA